MQEREGELLPVAWGSVGLGGYAGAAYEALLAASETPFAAVRLVGVCEPDGRTHAASIAEARKRGVAIYERFDELLAAPVEAVWLPLPIHLHRPFAERALAAGKAVLCEKPAAGSVDDVDAMIAARDRATLPLVIGFQDIYEPATLTLKRRLLDGAIGTLQSATVLACWPRSDRYYARAAWAGRRAVEGTWVMDSPASNALAHYITLALFLLGARESDAAQPASVTAELYRARPIETYDTCGLRVMTDAGAPVLTLLTHACRRSIEPLVEIRGSQGLLRFMARDRAEIQTARGTETVSLREATRQHMVRRVTRLVRGLPLDGPVATLEMARAHVVVVNGASEAASVHDIPASYVDEVAHDDGGTVRAVRGIEDLWLRCAEAQLLPHELGHAPWTAPGGTRDLRSYDHFAGPA